MTLLVYFQVLTDLMQIELNCTPINIANNFSQGVMIPLIGAIRNLANIKDVSIP